MDKRASPLLSELPGPFLAHLVRNYLDPGMRLALRETCTTLRAKVDAYSHPRCSLGGAKSLQDRFLMVSQVSDGIKELDVSSCDSDLSPDAADAVLPPGSWQKLKHLECHCKQMVLVKKLVSCSPKKLASISISARKGNWQHAGLLLQQLQRLPCLNTVQLALPAQHKLEELIASLTQIKALELKAAPRTSQRGQWPYIPLLGSSSKTAMVDPAFWQGAIRPLTQLTSLHLELPFTSISAMQLQCLSGLRQLQCCCARDVLPDLLEAITALQALTNLAIDAKVGRRISPMAMAHTNMKAPDLQPIGNLTALVQLQLNLHEPLHVASLLPLQSCKQLKLLGAARLQMQLPWRDADLSPASAEAADAAEAALVAAVSAGQLDVPLAQVLLTTPGPVPSAPLNVQGVSDVTMPLLPQLQELRVATMTGRLPLLLLAPHITELCIQGHKRLWSHRKGFGPADDMEALIDVLGVGPPMVGGGANNVQPGAAAAVGPPPPPLAGPAGAPAAGGAAGPAAPAGAAADADAAVAGGPIGGNAPAAGFAGGGPLTMRGRAAAQAAAVLVGLTSLQSLDLNFTQLCGICLAPGGRAVLDGVVELTVLMRGSGNVPGGVPHMPRLKRLCFYDSYDTRVPVRSLSASYDQTEDHQLWINQSIEELTISGSYILGGFYDANAVLKAKAQFSKLRRWVFRDCMDLSIGHLASLLAVRVAPIVRLEGATVLSHNDVNALIAMNAGCGVELQWAAHVPPQVAAPANIRDHVMGMMEMDFMGPWEPDVVEINAAAPEVDPFGVDAPQPALFGGQQGAAAAGALADDAGWMAAGQGNAEGDGAGMVFNVQAGAQQHQQGAAVGGQVPQQQQQAGQGVAVAGQAPQQQQAAEQGAGQPALADAHIALIQLPQNNAFAHLMQQLPGLLQQFPGAAMGAAAGQGMQPQAQQAAAAGGGAAGNQIQLQFVPFNQPAAGMVGLPAQAVAQQLQHFQHGLQAHMQHMAAAVHPGAAQQAGGMGVGIAAAMQAMAQNAVAALQNAAAGGAAAANPAGAPGPAAAGVQGAAGAQGQEVLHAVNMDLATDESSDGFDEEHGWMMGM